MKYAVFDIGSNSVRVMLREKGVTLCKRLIVTGLGRGLETGGMISESAAARTLAAISSLKAYAESEGAERFYAFGTAAMRKAANGGAFSRRIERETGVAAEIVSGEEEAALGLLGALGGRDGGIVDIGGASTEITVSAGGRRIYTHSLDLGSVTLTDACGQNAEKAAALCAKKIEEYGAIPAAEYCGIGGTATSLAAIALKLSPYDPARVQGYAISRLEMRALADRLSAMSVEERRTLKGLQPERAEVIGGGAILFSAIMERFGMEKITVSESDNLEGYALSRLETEEKQ